MKHSNYNNRDYYPDTSRGGFSSSKSYTQKRHNLSSSKVSEGKSKFENRVEKACPTNSIEAYKKQIGLLKKELQNLQKQNLKKDNKIFQMQSSYNMNRQIQSELQQTYRIIYMYEGKIQELEKQLKRLQKKIADNIEITLNAEDIESLFNQYRNENMQMRGVIEQQNRIIFEYQQKLKTIQSKYFHTSWKLSNQNRMISNPLKKKFPKLRDTIVIQDMTLAEREKMMGQLDTKYQSLNKQSQRQKANMQAQLNQLGKKSLTRKSVQQFNKSSNFTIQTPPSPSKVSKVYNLNTKKQTNVINNLSSFNSNRINNNNSYNIVQKAIQSPTKVYGQTYLTQSTAADTSKQSNKSSSYQFYRASNQNNNSQFIYSNQNPQVSYNYSQSPKTSQNYTLTSQNNNYSTSSQNKNNGASSQNQSYNNSSQNYSLSSPNQNRIISNSRVITNGSGGIVSSNQLNRNQHNQNSQSPSTSPRIIKLNKNPTLVSTSQNQSDNYYKTSTNYPISQSSANIKYYTTSSKSSEKHTNVY